MFSHQIDYSLFGSDAIPDEVNEANRQIEAALKVTPTAKDIGAVATRERRRNSDAPLAMEKFHPRARWEIANALGREVPVRVLTPEGPLRGALLHIHGGGHTLGSADSQDQTLMAMAERLEIAVVAVEYRLAPEHCFPAGPDDCETAAIWLAENTEKMFGTNRLLIAGESAGGHLSASTLLRMRHRHNFMPFLGANLVYGQYDLSGLPSIHTWGTRNLVLNTEIVHWFNDNFLPPEDFPLSRRRDPEISPLYADLNDLCPALFTCGTLDPLIDDTLIMAQRWVQAHNDADVLIYPGAIHGFTLLPDYPGYLDAQERMEKWLNNILSA